MKLLWSKILQKTNNRPDCINSTHVNQYWKELCMDKRYSNICHYKDEKDIMIKIETSLNKFAIQKKHKQLNQKKEENKLNQKRNNSKVTSYPSPTLSDSSIISNNDTQVSITPSKISYNINNNNNNDNISIDIYNSLSSISDINNSESISNNDTLYSNTLFVQYIPYTTTVYIPSNQIFYNSPNENKLSNQYQQQLTQVTYIQEQPQKQYICY